MIKPILATVGTLVILAGCTPPAPVVSDFNGDSVKIQTISYSDDEIKAASQAEADRICATRGRTAEYTSTVTLPNYMAEHLYLCLDRK